MGYEKQNKTKNPKNRSYPEAKQTIDTCVIAAMIKGWFDTNDSKERHCNIQRASRVEAPLNRNKINNDRSSW